jgi:ketosteroid isomerase-like protein
LPVVLWGGPRRQRDRDALSRCRVDVSDFLDGEVYKGRAAIRAFWEYLYEEVWESVEMVEEGLIDAGDTVVAMVRFQGAGRSSGAPVDLPIAWTFEFRRGCIARVKFSLDRTAALEAVGRREQRPKRA